MTSMKRRCAAHCGRVVPDGEVGTSADAPWVVVGCGYVGMALARRLAAEGRVVAITRRDAAAAQRAADELDQLSPAGSPRVRAAQVDLARPIADFASGSIVVCLAPPGPEPEREIGHLVQASQGCRLVYVSSTGVYAPGGGAWVDERWPIEPVTAAGRARASAERALPPDAAVLRVAGIYGPGRGLAARLAAGTYRIIGDGSAHVSRIHVDDLVEAIVRAGSGQLAGPVNVADDDPAPIGELADLLAVRLGVALPPRIAAADVDPEVAGMLTADRRIANWRMKRELGVVLRHPSFRT